MPGPVSGQDHSWVLTQTWYHGDEARLYAEGLLSITMGNQLNSGFEGDQCSKYNGERTPAACHRNLAYFKEDFFFPIMETQKTQRTRHMVQ